jgi:hypothetical protein
MVAMIIVTVRVVCVSIAVGMRVVMVMAAGSVIVSVRISMRTTVRIKTLFAMKH